MGAVLFLEYFVLVYVCVCVCVSVCVFVCGSGGLHLFRCMLALHVQLCMAMFSVSHLLMSFVVF